MAAGPHPRRRDAFGVTLWEVTVHLEDEVHTIEDVLEVIVHPAAIELKGECGATYYPLNRVKHIVRIMP